MGQSYSLAMTSQMQPTHKKKELDRLQYEMLVTAGHYTAPAQENTTTYHTQQDDNEQGVPIFLTPYQSCQLHGWGQPKRVLTWLDVRRNPSITFKRCMQSGIRVESLHMLQPNVHKWIESAKVSLSDVPHMTLWPLHPIKHLRGDISDLATMRYDASVLSSMGITYPYMRKELLMDDEWMKMLHYKPWEWCQHLNFDTQCAEDMGSMRTFKVFGMDVDMLKLAMSSSSA